MLGETTSLGYIPAQVAGLNAGNLYNVVVSFLVFFGCAYAAWMIYSRGKKDLTQKAFALFLGLVGLHWLGVVFGNLTAWLNLVQLASWFAYPIKITFVLPAVVLGYFFAAGIWQNKSTVRRVTFLFVVAASAMVVVSWRLDSTLHTITYWGVQWQVGALARLIYIVGLLLPLAVLAVYSILKDSLEMLLKKKSANFTLYFGAGIFVLLEYLQISIVVVTWQRLLARLLYILIAFGAYLFFVSRVQENRFIPRAQELPPRKMIRVPFFTKLLFFFTALAVLPITISSLLMFVSFKEIIDQYVHKPLLWDVKTSREAFVMALDHLQVQSLFLLVLTGLLVFLAAVLIAKTLSVSLRNISLGMGRVSKGDFSFRVQPDSNDEIGDLANYFNDMSDEIKRSREIMQQWNRELETKVAERTEDLRALYNISKAIGSSLDFKLLISRAIDNLLPVIKADGYCVLVPNEAGKFISRLSRGIEFNDLEITEGQGLLGEALQKKAVIFSEDVSRDPRCQDDYYKQTGLKTLLVSPLRAKGKIMGILIIGSRGMRNYAGDREVNLLAAISDQLAISLENVGIYEKEKEAVARLTELDRLKNEFISMVSHELRTPVTSVDGYVSLFLAGATGPLTEDQKKYLNIVKENDVRLLTLINRLLDFSKIEAGRFTIKRELVSLNDIINAAAKTLEQQLSKKQTKIKLNLKASNANFMGDREKMIEVFINLIENALKFGQEQEPLNVEISTRDEGDFIQVEVKDNGIGVDKEHLEKIFNKFYQIEDTMTRKVGGVGLGLAIVKEIIGNHNGKIWAESAGQGKGTTILFTLPVAEKV
ncbi:MAG: GAF domain-containing protein [Candidatus Margulisbacteria bacterium]|nr:GAF domain-containing protein [Candidatus Margulisiibacteriota bacterium]